MHHLYIRGSNPRFGVQSKANTSEMPNIEVSGELDNDEQSYGDLTFSIKPAFFPVSQ
jgi:hypothetical protein